MSAPDGHQGGEGFIYPDWLEPAANLEIDQQRGWEAEPIDIGLDVARSAKGDKTVFVVVKGGVVLKLISSRQDLMRRPAARPCG